MLPRILPQVQAATGIGVQPGDQPTWRVQTLSGAVLGSEDLVGKVVVVTFWATWCPPCRVEMPALQRLYRDRADEGVVVVGLSTDVGGERVIRDYVDDGGFTFPIARADRTVREAFGGIRGVPTTVILDRQGRITHRVYGFFAPPAMRLAVGRLLRGEEAGHGSR